MRVLLDNCVDQRFGLLLTGCDVVHARSMGWDLLENGALIAQAEASGFNCLITVDKNLRYQQNISNRKIGIVILDSARITHKHIAPLAEQVMRILQDLPEGSYRVVKAERI